MSGRDRLNKLAGVSFACPCGTRSPRICAACNRTVCRDHSALGPFAAKGGVMLRPVCHPVCDAPWWTKQHAVRSPESAPSRNPAASGGSATAESGSSVSGGRGGA